VTGIPYGGSRILGKKKEKSYFVFSAGVLKRKGASFIFAYSVCEQKAKESKEM